MMSFNIYTAIKNKDRLNRPQKEGFDMEVIKTIQLFKQRIKEARKQDASTLVGFVPTMGYLHEGHASLLKTAKEQSSLVVLSIFVNPLQFGPNEDFERYPRDTERDLALASNAGVDIVFLPSVEEMYPKEIRTTVSVNGLTERLCGGSRPGHFDGVATVVSKLFHIVEPDKAFFGLKDAQQVAVLTQMVSDLNMNVEIIPCPTLREPDGLAMSSRNVYLSEEGRKQALVLSQSLQLAQAYVNEHSGFSAANVMELVSSHIKSASLAVIDYVELLEYPSLSPITEVDRYQHSIIIALAVKFGSTRLIDNLIILQRK
jgi:pantoate--beta-alanine ligase